MKSGKTFGPIHGFTLVELLVSIAVISILAGLLLPVLKRARDQAHMVQCMGNLRQQYHVYTFYLEDSSSYFPPGFYQYALYPYITDEAVPLQADGDPNNWKMKTRGSVEILMCPTLAPLYSPGPHDWGRSAMWVNTYNAYAQNTGIGAYYNKLSNSWWRDWWWPLYGDMAFHRPTQVRVPEGTHLISDSGDYDGGEITLGTNDTTIFHKTWSSYNKRGPIRHEQTMPGGFVLFCDGHVRWMPVSMLRRQDSEPWPKEVDAKRAPLFDPRYPLPTSYAGQ